MAESVRARDGAERAPQLAHHCGRVDAAPDDVADRDGDAFVVERDHVVPVATHRELRNRRHIACRNRDVGECEGLRAEHGALQRRRNRSLEFEQAGTVERLGEDRADCVEQCEVVGAQRVGLVEREEHHAEHRVTLDEREVHCRMPAEVAHVVRESGIARREFALLDDDQRFAGVEDVHRRRGEVEWEPRPPLHRPQAEPDLGDPAERGRFLIEHEEPAVRAVELGKQFGQRRVPDLRQLVGRRQPLGDAGDDTQPRLGRGVQRDVLDGADEQVDLIAVADRRHRDHHAEEVPILVSERDLEFTAVDLTARDRDHAVERGLLARQRVRVRPPCVGWDGPEHFVAREPEQPRPRIVDVDDAPVARRDEHAVLQ